MEKRKPCALTGVRTTIYMYVYDYRSNFRMPSYKFLIVATSEWLDLLRRPCYFIPLYVITMLRCVSFETAHCSKSCCCTVTKHMAVNRASDSVLWLWKYYCRFGVITKYPLRIRYGILTRLQAGRAGVRIPAERKLVFFSKTSRPALRCCQPSNRGLFRGKSVWIVKLTIPLHQAPRLRMSGVILLLPSYMPSWPTHDEFDWYL